GLQELNRAASERAVAFSQRQNASHPPQQRVTIALLRLDIYRFVVVFGIEDDGQIKRLRTRSREAGIFIRTPLHRRADTISVAEEDIITHADFIAVIQNRRAWKREQQHFK